MNHKKRKQPTPVPPNCAQCNKHPQVAGRADKLCMSCGHYADMAKRLVGK